MPAVLLLFGRQRVQKMTGLWRETVSRRVQALLIQLQTREGLLTLVRTGYVRTANDRNLKRKEARYGQEIDENQ